MIFIRIIEEYIKLSDNEKEYAASLFTKKHFKKKQMLLTEGAPCNWLGIIEKGIIRYYINKDGEESTYLFGSAGDFVSDIENFIKGKPTTKNIQALEDIIVWQITKSSLELFYRNIREGERFGRLITEKHLIEAVQHIISFLTDPPSTRYEKFRSLYPGLEQKIPQYYIASFCGVKPQSLSRIRKRISLG